MLICYNKRLLTGVKNKMIGGPGTGGRDCAVLAGFIVLCCLGICSYLSCCITRGFVNGGKSPIGEGSSSGDTTYSLM